MRGEKSEDARLDQLDIKKTKNKKNEKTGFL